MTKSGPISVKNPKINDRVSSRTYIAGAVIVVALDVYELLKTGRTQFDLDIQSKNEGYNAEYELNKITSLLGRTSILASKSIVLIGILNQYYDISLHAS